MPQVGAKGLEPLFVALQASVLPLNYAPKLPVCYYTKEQFYPYRFGGDEPLSKHKPDATSLLVATQMRFGGGDPFSRRQENRDIALV